VYRLFVYIPLVKVKKSGSLGSPPQLSELSTSSENF